jgi:hypothetical protein
MTVDQLTFKSCATFPINALISSFLFSSCSNS